MTSQKCDKSRIACGEIFAEGKLNLSGTDEIALRLGHCVAKLLLMQGLKEK